MNIRTAGWDVFGWGIGLLLLVLGLRMLQADTWHGAPLVILSCVPCLPPLWRRANSKLRVNLHGILYVGLSIVLVSVGISLAADQQTKAKEKAERDAQSAMQQRVEDRRSAAEAEFRANKLAIVGEAQRLFDAGDFAGVRAAVGRFGSITDPDLARVRDAASLILLRQELEQRPTEERLAVIYAEIARLDPSDVKASAKSVELGSQIAERRAQEARRQARAGQVRSQFSGWDGAHPAVERAIKARLKSPDSYQHIKTTYLDTGSENFTVFTEFRGTNSFNAVVSNSATAVVTPGGEVVSVSIR